MKCRATPLSGEARRKSKDYVGDGKEKGRKSNLRGGKMQQNTIISPFVEKKSAK